MTEPRTEHRVRREDLRKGNDRSREVRDDRVELLPAIVSAEYGASNIITHGVDGVILDHSKDPPTVPRRNGRELAEIFEDIFRRKLGFVPRTLMQEP